MAVKEAVVDRFLELCAQRQIKPNELATRSGVTPSTVYSMIDARRRDISILTIKKLCDGFDISVRTFFDSPLFDDLEQEVR